jgi:signal peptidase
MMGLNHLYCFPTRVGLIASMFPGDCRWLVWVKPVDGVYPYVLLLFKLRYKTKRGYSVQNGNEIYTSREEVEELLRKTREIVGSKLQGSSSSLKKKLSAGKLARRIVYGLVVVSLLAMLGKVWIARINGQVPDLFGYQMYVVETGSMIPTLPIGSTLIVRELRQDEELKAGDIITYSHESAAITHRITDLVVGVDGVTRYQTQGDNPDNSADPWLVNEEDVRGIVLWHFLWPWAGK